jgi:hypothetical protein
MKVTMLSALLGLAAAECPNACSGHGTCGAKDSCSCYQNYQGNDCSERTCYFGIAHVDTPKGDLNADGYVSGPLTTVITGSEVYPWGTTEQYPNADANEGHFYMECSNKGMCDRKTGTCDCFDGYEGTACVRASCPNDCSGHGTCESIKELSEQKGFNTNAHDVPTTRTAGASTNAGLTNHHNFDLAIEESYAYDLWDQDKTLGCKCDPVYYGADCSLKKCKYGVDPLFFDNSDGVIKQTTVVHLGSKSARNADIGGTFRIVFYDVFGEKYVTKQIDASRASTSAGVRAALEALPNGVIAHSSVDITGTPPIAVTVSKAAIAGVHTTTGTIGAGAEGELGAGLGVSGAAVGTGATDSGYGPEFTVTFNTNPGMLKSIELDTREINNPGTPDYWVANTRQGQFSSRYSTNLGRVQGLAYGSKLLYTNSDWSIQNGANTMVKIGGQEARVTAGNSYQLSLSEPYLGASIIPTLTDTGAAASGLAADLVTLIIEAPGTSIISNHLLEGAKLYTGGCSVTSNVGGSTTAATAKSLTSLTIYNTHDCHSDMLTVASPIYRRTDDPTNQNLYKTADTAVATDALLTQRGSPDVYVINAATAGADGVIKAYNSGASRFTGSAVGATATGVATGVNVFVNGMGPYTAAAAVTAAATDVVLDAASAGKATLDFASTNFLATAIKFPLQITKTPNAALTAGAILALNGRRYKVQSASTTVDGKVTLTENFAGGQLLQLCSNCVTDAAADGTTLTSAKKLSIAANDKIYVGGYVNEDLATTVESAVTDALSIPISAGTRKGTRRMVNSPAGTPAALTGQTLALYREVNTNRYIGSIITEVDTANPFQYVSQCSNRGTCDSATGVCKCFKGYGNDNCDNQNMLAM